MCWRRLVVKPGITILWQVNGRSDRPWDEAVRLDLRFEPIEDAVVGQHHQLMTHFFLQCLRLSRALLRIGKSGNR